jgi:hypothetical protein
MAKERLNEKKLTELLDEAGIKGDDRDRILNMNKGEAASKPRRTPRGHGNAAPPPRPASL